MSHYRLCFTFSSVCWIIPHEHVVPQIEVIIFSSVRPVITPSPITRNLPNFHVLGRPGCQGSQLSCKEPCQRPLLSVSTWRAPGLALPVVLTHLFPHKVQVLVFIPFSSDFCAKKILLKTALVYCSLCSFMLQKLPSAFEKPSLFSDLPTCFNFLATAFFHIGRTLAKWN